MLNYHSAKSTFACVESLLRSDVVVNGSCQLEIFIIDNGSGIEEQQQLRRFLQDFDAAHLQANDENLGFSAGHNRNLQTIFALQQPNFVWLLNNDCLVAEKSLHALIECAQQRPSVGIWGATLLESDGNTIQCAGGCSYNSWISSYRQYGRGKALAQVGKLKRKEYDYIAGASLFFPVATLLDGLLSLSGSSTKAESTKQQWLNESYFLYFEELDLAKRLKPGLGIDWCKDALIIHSGGTSTGTGGNQRSELAEYHSTLSTLKFTKWYYPRRLWLVIPARYVSKCLLLLARGEGRLIKVMTKAYRDFWSS